MWIHNDYMHSSHSDLVTITAAACESGNEIMSSAAQQESVRPQETHHHQHVYNLQINYNVVDLALHVHRAEESLPDTDNFASKLLVASYIATYIYFMYVKYFQILYVNMNPILCPW